MQGAVTERAPEPPIEIIRRETIMNQEAFARLRIGIARHEGEYALMKSGLIIDFFPDRRSALVAGHDRFIDRLFSVHRVQAHERRRADGPAPPVERRQAGTGIA